MSPSWVRRTLAGAALALLVDGVLVIAGTRPDPVAVVAAAFGAVAVLSLLLDGLASGERVEWQPRSDPTIPADRADRQLRAWTWLIRGHLDSRRPDDTLRRRLLRLADERLDQVYGVTTGEDPERAAALLGPAYAELTDPAPRRMSLTEMSGLVDRIAEL